MRCYFIAQIKIHDEAEYAKYLDGVDEVFAKFGGKYLSVDKCPVVLEGTWDYSRVAMMEFPSEEELRRWYESPEYQDILKHRLKGAHCDTLIVKGLE